MIIYSVYDDWEDELCVMSGTSRQVARKLKVSRKKITDYARCGYRLFGRYRIVAENDEKGTKKS